MNSDSPELQMDLVEQDRFLELEIMKFRSSRETDISLRLYEYGWKSVGRSGPDIRDFLSKYFPHHVSEFDQVIKDPLELVVGDDSEQERQRKHALNKTRYVAALDALAEFLSGIHLEISKKLQTVIGRPGFQAPTEWEPVGRGEEYRRLLKIKQRLDPTESYIGKSVPMLRVFERIELYNRERCKPILILGESGTGKSEIGELIHLASGREGPYRRISSMLGATDEFGWVHAQWLGYGRDSGLKDVPKEGRGGLLQECRGGTIFVDEIAMATPELQTFLLDVIDGKAIPYMHGKGEAVIPEVRLLLATNRDPVEAVREGTMKRDLYRRLEARRLAQIHG